MASVRRLYANDYGQFHLMVNKTMEYFMGRKENKGKQNGPLWFRGIAYSHYDLLPTLLRKPTVTPIVTGKYNRIHLEEDYRFQHFSARAYHQVHAQPTHDIEWQEIMQHHGVATRLMDWSENAHLALLFALENYFYSEAGEAPRHDRINLTPTVWVLSPDLLNRRVFESLKQRELIYTALADIVSDKDKREILADEVHEQLCADGIFFDAPNYSLNHVFSLSGLNKLRHTAGDRLENLLQSGEFNPFFYMLLRIYSDGLQTENKDIPPLAIIHPYHSERILSQKGAFTVFPFSNHIPAIPMQRQADCAECLCEIRITNPRAVAKSLMDYGYRLSTVYPELPNYASDIERPASFDPMGSAKA